MEITFMEVNRHLICRPSGEIDHHTSAEIRQKIDRAFNQSKCKNIIFDFSAVEFMDSSGIGILIGRYKELTKQGGRVYAVGVAGEVSRLFKISGLARIIPCYDSVDDAVRGDVG